MHAGLARARGDLIVTMDGDLQNEPEDIPKLLDALARADVASGRRIARRDSPGRTCRAAVSTACCAGSPASTISDFGCAFNGYRRAAIEPMMGSIGRQKFTKALVLSSRRLASRRSTSRTPPRSPAPATRRSAWSGSRCTSSRASGRSPCSGSASRSGVVCSLAAAALGIYGVVYWIVNSNFPGPLFAGAGIVLVLGIQGFVLALIGESLGRIQRDVEGRPLYTIEEEL